MNDNRRIYFQMMSREEQEVAVRRLASSGMGDYTIAAASGLSIEQIRKILAKAQAA